MREFEVTLTFFLLPSLEQGKEWVGNHQNSVNAGCTLYVRAENFGDAEQKVAERLAPLQLKYKIQSLQ